MEIKRILVVLEAGMPNGSRLETAVRLAEQMDAELTALATWREPEPDLADCYAMGEGAAAAVLARRDLAASTLLQPLEDAFRAAVARRGVVGQWRIAKPEEAAKDIALRARWFDLVVVGARGDSDAGLRLGETLATDSGAALMLVRESGQEPPPFDRILVAWDGGREVRRAVEAGLEFLKRAKSVQLVIAVGGDVTAGAEAEALSYLARHGVNAEVERVGSRDEDASAALLRHCVLFEADLLIMGAFGHTKLQERLFGGVTQAVLADASTAVLTIH